MTTSPGIDDRIRMFIGVPLGYRHCTFENFRVNEWNGVAYLKAVEYATQPKNRGLLIFGNDSGTGKTHLAVSSSVRCAMDRREMHIFTPGYSFFEGMRMMRLDGYTLDEAAAVYLSSRLLLDDFHVRKEKPTEHQIESFYSIIDTMYRMDNKRIIITTNLQPSLISDFYGDKVMSRLVGMCEVVEMKGNDGRMDERYDNVVAGNVQ